MFCMFSNFIFKFYTHIGNESAIINATSRPENVKYNSKEWIQSMHIFLKCSQQSTFECATIKSMKLISELGLILFRCCGCFFYLHVITFCCYIIHFNICIFSNQFMKLEALSKY